MQSAISELITVENIADRDMHSGYVNQAKEQLREPAVGLIYIRSRTCPDRSGGTLTRKSETWNMSTRRKGQGSSKLRDWYMKEEWVWLMNDGWVQRMNDEYKCTAGMNARERKVA